MFSVLNSYDLFGLKTLMINLSGKNAKIYVLRSFNDSFFKENCPIYYEADSINLCMPTLNNM